MYPDNTTIMLVVLSSCDIPLYKTIELFILRSLAIALLRPLFTRFRTIKGPFVSLREATVLISFILFFPVLVWCGVLSAGPISNQMSIWSSVAGPSDSRSGKTRDPSLK